MKKTKILLIILLIPLSLFSQWGGGEKYPELKTNAESLQKWQEMKFGLFIHWGPVSLRGTEIGWSRGREVPIAEYDNLYQEFNPVLFDAREWVSMAKAAGMKYIIITSKHHDGFCIWDSDFTDYDIMSTPFKRDILKELSEECQRQGILFGTYHSILDWHHPHYTTRYGGDPRPVAESDMNQYVVYLKSQVRELIEKYGTNILWFDGEWEASWTHELGMDLYQYVRSLKDDALINNRVDTGRRGMHGMTKSEKFAGDFGTPEQEIGAFRPDTPWESCITICSQWAWKPNDQMKDLRECIQTLARTVGGGGNLLFNVGPMLDGRIEQRQIDQLLEMGLWLAKNGESIYGTKAGPFKPTDWLVSTHKDNFVYLHLFAWPDGKLVLPNFKKPVLRSVKMMSGAPLKFEQNKAELSIELPEEPPDHNDTVIRLEFDKNIGTIEPVEVQSNVIKGLQGAKIQLKTNFSQQYAARGVKTLADETRASLSHTDGKWLGFEQNDFVAEVDLGAVKPVKKIGLGCLQNQDSWIFLPKSAEISISDDGKAYKSIAKIENITVEPNQTIVMKDFTVSLDNIQARYIQIKAENVGVCPEWHKGAGGKAWLFVDEIFVE